ncbi:TetR/AcrR family transcriptional regulator [Desulfovibrio sulfodismutans]|uniref:TetR/AcrR family transcriptional regulator n=1 Tax=Desulfolutivibrio sulfodismutans TaxID=63561 RepID=A0A7K3NJ07_9BACT|nr:TetR/AcrR family transcriptional regulator [Desulfolutivibrio sulfodismutans]NDY55765.1 TetR/AcrR family transcriptional regulator [Desulfolutivibrio sulfodismutans]
MQATPSKPLPAARRLDILTEILVNENEMGRNQEQNQLQRDTQRARILSSSLRLFVSRGFAATRITDIAAETGISSGLLYHYFQSKDDMLVALLQESLPKMDAAARDLEAMELPVADKIRLALRLLIRGIQENAETGKFHLLVALVSASEALPDAARQILARHAHGPYQIMERIFAKGQAEGSVRSGNPRDMAMLFWALVKGLSIHHSIHGNTLGEADPESVLPLFLK